MLVVIATVFGVAISVPPLVGMSMGITGQPVPMLPLVPGAILVGAMGALALVALAVATHAAMRTRPVDEIGSRQ